MSVVFVALALAGCAGAPRAAGPDVTGGDEAAPAAGAATVTRVVDGDTIVVDLGGRAERVRLVGIDTPETVSPVKPLQCFGHEASAHTTALLPPGTPVRLERDAEERDAYGRLLAYVFRAGDGLFVNLALVRDGFASTLSIAPNVAHRDEFESAARESRQHGLGLWGACGGPGIAATATTATTPAPAP